MRKIRVYVDAPMQIGRQVSLPEFAAHHAVRVLRLREGDPLTLFNGDGQDYHGVLSHTRKDLVTVTLGSAEPVSRESPLKITLIQAMARGEKMDLILQKAAELGVTNVLPVVTERTEVKLEEDRLDKRMMHWKYVLASACEQCGRAEVPSVAAPVVLHELPQLLGAKADGELRLALHPEPAGSPDLPAQVTSVCLLIGPEGGLTARDLAQVKQAGFQTFGMGPRILRTETAGLAAITLMQARYGDFAVA
ncbi:16S rRNA (uracil(1498)-N(3))-methyltransferase [Ahniella affigens]|uniref:Ribosomal RNA small subunit methyltransferase E n=1 Tax=Ahniella affigens TaxID=2021234 RepID=A0A2P1PQC1_9GAMM|nr:16S rRNA (uracil(1498)-N(3))-methyltransferase [Ahniella affigens]AVP97045.1 16S rRNA (uracil(1498)-N(3))-methyltransferase [Ahniella affigens]